MRTVKLTLRFLIKWFPAVVLSGLVTFFTTVYGFVAVFNFTIDVIIGICVAFACGVLACIIVFGLAWLFEKTKAWIYED